MNDTPPNSMRLAKHRDEIRDRFAKIIKTCRVGVQLSAKERETIGIKKKCTVVLDPDARVCHWIPEFKPSKSSRLPGGYYG